MQPLNVMVHGTAATCRSVAAWFGQVAEKSTGAADAVQQSRMSANAGWWGPAQQRFTEMAYGPVLQCDDLAATCRQYSTALYDFADSLDAVVNRMNEAVDKALSGGLTAEHELLIFPPNRDEMIGPQPSPPDDPTPENIGSYRQAAQAYNAQVDAYNAKVAVFNECSAIVKEARIVEDQAHTDLAGNLRADGPPPNVDASWEIGNTSAQSLLGGIEGNNDGRMAVLNKLNRLGDDTSVFTQLATARNGDQQLTKAQRDAYLRAAAKAGANHDRYLSFLDAWEKRTLPAALHSSRVPPGFAQYGGARRALVEFSPKDATRVAKIVIRGVPVVGDVFTVGDEIYKGVSGQQTARATVIRSIGMVGTGMIGGAAGALVGGTVGSFGGPPGIAIGAGVGSFLGDMFVGGAADEGLDELLKQVLPDDVDPRYNQPRVAEEGRIYEG
jgi:hypothetical protein